MALTQADVQNIINTNVTTNGQNKNSGAGLDAALTTLNQAVFQPANLPIAPYSNPVWYGADPTGVSDSTAAFVAAIAASNNVEFPPGKYKFLSQITHTVPSKTNLRIAGAGSGQTILFWPGSGGGISLTLADATSTFSLQGCSGTVGVANGGTFFSVTQSATVATPANTAPSLIWDVVAHGNDGFAATDYWSTAFKFSKVSNVSFIFVNVFGSSSIAGYGVQIDGSSTTYAVVYNFAFFFSYANQVGIQMGVTNGYVQGLTVNNSNFTACDDCIDSAGSLVGLSQLSVSNCQFNYVLHGIATYSAIEFVNITTSLFLAQANSAFAVALVRAQSFSVIGNSIQSYGYTTTTGVYVGTTVNEGGTITGNSFSFTSVAINLDTPSTNCVVALNNYFTVSTPVINSGTNNSVGTASVGAMAGVVP